MPKVVLAPHARAARRVSPTPEPRLAGWPGTDIPNFSDWQLGDLVLVRAEAGLIGAALVAGQGLSRRSAVRKGLLWTHVGLYVGGDEMVEAVPGQGVGKSSVWKYCQYRRLQVRRLTAPFNALDGASAAAAAIAAIGQPYSMSALVLSKLVPRTAPDPDALFCSTFVALAINAATGFSLYSDPKHLPVHPAVLATHPDLANVELEWRHL